MRAVAAVATYRLQLHAGFTFDDARELVPYLAALGISHLYLSPILQARRGSSHGYDQCDPTRVSQDLGGEAGFTSLCGAAREHGLGIMLDIVPNHMAASHENPWWWELLATGQQGPRGGYFDIDWDAPGMEGRVLLPVLGAPLADVVANGQLERVSRDGQPALRYVDRLFPLDGEDIGKQHYLLADWHDTARLNYRRFFDINDLVGLREEEPEVFDSVHGLVLRLVADGDVDGLRVDHVDGLRDPTGYLAELRRQAPRCRLLVEKILEPGEHLAAGWPVDGTTGYDFIHRLQGVFVDPAAEARLSAFYADFTGETADYTAVVVQAKEEAARGSLAADVSRVERAFAVLCAEHGLAAEGAAREAAITAVAARLPVYRCYLGPEGEASGADRAYIAAAVGDAAGREPAPRADLLRLLRESLTGELRSPGARELALRFQQLSAPLMAKGVEDTAYYRYLRLVCLNEVGCDPGTFGVTPEEFHRANARASDRYPLAMLASSTHDTKRSEDVRARLTLLTQAPEEWIAAVSRWTAINNRHRRHGLRDRNAEYLLYQTLVGAWPLSPARACQYMEKAVREAKQRTSWAAVDDGYEAALRDFTTAALADPEFTADLEAFVEPLVEPGFIVSLAQCLLKLTAPGVPDIYQGNELWDLSLVDPDNRRPVDFGLRRELLDVANGQDAIDPGEHRWDDGLAKLHVITRGLNLRRGRPSAFGEGSTYTPLAARGPAAEHVLGFARGTVADPMSVVVVVPRFTLGRKPDWEATSVDLGPGRWTDRLWDGPEAEGPLVSAGLLFARHTLALLERAA